MNPPLITGCASGLRLVAVTALMSVLIALASCRSEQVDNSAPPPMAAERPSPSMAPQVPVQRAEPDHATPLPSPNVISSAPAPAPAAVIGEAVLSYPDDLLVQLLADRLLGIEPPLIEWAAADVAAKSANEFTDRDQLVTEALKPYQELYATTAGVGVLELRVSSQFSQYDGQSKAYYLTALSPGTVLTFSSYKYRNRSVTLQLENLRQMQRWGMEPDAAEKLLTSNPGRQLTLDLTIDITGAEMRGSGPQLKGRIRQFDIYDPYGKQLLTTVTP